MQREIQRLEFVFALDHEGGQWTFFKPPLADLRTRYGIDVQEMTPWRPLSSTHSSTSAPASS